MPVVTLLTWWGHIILQLGVFIQTLFRVDPTNPVGRLFERNR